MKLPLAYCIEGKCGGVFNLVIWWSGDVMSVIRAKMRRCAEKNGPAKAFPQVEIASYQDSISKRGLVYIVAEVSHLGVEILNHQITLLVGETLCRII